MKNEGLSFARQFKPLSQDALDFGGLSPLESGLPWSVIAFIQPTTSQQYAGIISKRTEFKIGKNQFTFWLKNGSISVEADTQGGTSGLVPPLNRWSYVGAASSSHQTTIYLGVDGEVSFEHRKGIVTGTGWTAVGLGDVDAVSGSAPNVIGTKLIRLDDLRPKSSTAEPPKQAIASDAKQAVESLDDRKNSEHAVSGPFFQHAGRCPACGAETTFVAEGPYFRNTLTCAKCKSAPRHRALMHLLSRYFPTWHSLKVHESSPGWDIVSQRLARECRDYTASQYDPRTPSGALVEAPRMPCKKYRC